MENRIKLELELRGRKPNEVADLYLGSCKATQIQGLTNEFVNLEMLSMADNGLTTLKGFPALPNLKVLDLSYNEISGTLDLLAGSPGLSHLNLSGNKIKDLKTVKPLAKFTQLTSLLLVECDVPQTKAFRKKIFKLIPSLKFLDFCDSDGKDEPAMAVPMDWEIAAKVGDKKKEVLELSLDNCKSTQIQGLTDEFVSLEILSLIHAGLTTLKGFPALPNLKRLDLSDNAITGTLDLLVGSPNLSYLNLSKNKFTDFEAFKPLNRLAKLSSLDLFGCELSDYDDYREKIFELIPSLRFLDGYDKDGNEEAFIGSATKGTTFAGRHKEEDGTPMTQEQSKAVDVQVRERHALAAAAGFASIEEYDDYEDEQNQKACQERINAKQVLPVVVENEVEESEGEGEEGDEVPEDEDEISDEEDGAEGQNNHAGPSGKKPSNKKQNGKKQNGKKQSGKKPRGKKHAEEDEAGEDD